MIKYILVVPLLIAALLILSGFKQKSFYRFFLIGVALVGVFFVFNPDATTRIANMVGVGRGTDLILYLCVIAFFFTHALLYFKIRKMENAQTELVRQLAISNAKTPQVS